MKHTIYIGIFMFICVFPDTSGISEEKRLIRDLLDFYSKAGIIGRPVQKTTDIVVVEYGLGLVQILDLDEKNQILTINVWSRYTWTDQLLRWDPAKYANVTEVRVPPDKIWTPDIVLYNYADERLSEQRDVMAVINFNGRVMWIPPAIYKSTCEINIQNFPFDYQNCHLKFGSKTYDGRKLDIQFYNNQSVVNIDDYTVSNEWFIVGRPARRCVMYYPCCPNEPFPDLTFFLFLRRNPAFYAYLLVLPCVLLSSLTLVIFWLPPESPAKMVLGMNIFTAFFLLLLLLADSTPSASTRVPYLGYYYCLNMILVTLSSFFGVVVTNMYFRADKRGPLPASFKKTVDILSKILCLRQKITGDDKDSFHIIRKAPGTESTSGNRNRSPLNQSNIRSSIHQMSRSYSPTESINIPTYHALTHSSRIPASVQPVSWPTRPCVLPLAENISVRTAVAAEMSNHITPPDSGDDKGPVCPWIYHTDVKRRSAHPPTSSVTHNATVTNRVRTTSFQGRQQQQQHNFNSTGGVIAETKVDNEPHRTLEPDLQEIRRSICALMTRLLEKDRKNRTARESRMIALVLDRIFFWCYFIMVLVSGLVLLIPRAEDMTIEETLNKYMEIYIDSIPKTATTVAPNTVQIGPKY